jgi:histidine phosphotransferase ChpT
MSAPVSGPIALGALDLAALLCSRVCHDLISPVGAIVNGLEVLDENKDEETKTFALDLIKKSANQASAKLQFCRLAFGAAGSAGAQIDLGDAEKVARGLLADDKTTIVWNLPRELLPKNQVKLLLNMLLIAMGSIPRGGTLTVGKVEGGAAEAGSGMPAGGQGFRIAATGLNARLNEATAELLVGSPARPVDAHGIQPVYTGILARDCGLAVSAAVEGDAVVVTAR